MVERAEDLSRENEELFAIFYTSIETAKETKTQLAEFLALFATNRPLKIAHFVAY
jgi:hypothetical protein